MVEHESPYISIANEFKTNATFFDLNQTYDVTRYTSGLFYDVLVNLEQTLLLHYASLQ
jgi:hypothetical protein